MLESSLVSKVNKFAKENGYMYVNLQQTNINGIPDSLLIDKDGNHYWFELKREEGTTRISPIQEYRIKQMQDNYNCKVKVIYNIEQLKESL